MKKKNRIIISLLMMTMTFTLLGAESAKKNRTGQITFLYPLGTNGFESMDYANKISLNIIGGMNGGVDFLELGGVANYNSHDVIGFQGAGVLNVNREETSGIQLSGVANIDFGNTTGIICSGVVNGIFGNSNGAMVSTINATAGEMRGIQVGVINYATKSNGVHVGVINVVGKGADSLPIGVISFVKDGYFAIQASASEVLYGNVSYKMGVERLYTIFNVGSPFKDEIYSCGLGWGTLIPLSSRYKLAVEATSNQIRYNFNWKETNNQLNKLNMNVHFVMGDHLSLFVGPSYNVYVINDTISSKSLSIPYTFFNKMYDTTNVKMWVGGNIGLTWRLRDSK